MSIWCHSIIINYTPTARSEHFCHLQPPTRGRLSSLWQRSSTCLLTINVEVLTFHKRLQLLGLVLNIQPCSRAQNFIRRARKLEFRRSRVERLASEDNPTIYTIHNKAKVAIAFLGTQKHGLHLAGFTQTLEVSTALRQPYADKNYNYPSNVGSSSAIPPPWCRSVSL